MLRGHPWVVFRSRAPSRQHSSFGPISLSRALSNSVSDCEKGRSAGHLFFFFIKTAVDLYSIVGLSTATRFPGLGDFLQEGKRVTIRDKNRRQVLLLLGDNGGLCYETFGTLLEGLDNTGFY